MKENLLSICLLLIPISLSGCGSSAPTTQAGRSSNNETAASAPSQTPSVSNKETAVLANKSGDEIPKFEKGEKYAAVRDKLLKAGWQPFKSPDAQACSDGDPRCKDFPEMEACGGTGLGNCRYLWQRGGKTLAIMTIGEDIPVYDSQIGEKAKAPAMVSETVGKYVYSYTHDSGADSFVYELKSDGSATYISEREGADGEDLTGTWSESKQVVSVVFKNEEGGYDTVTFALQKGNLRQLTDPRTKGQDKGVRGFVGTVFKKQAK